MKVISTIGTSIIMNFINKIRNSKINEEKKALEAYNLLQKKGFKDKERYINEYNFLKNFLRQRIIFDKSASAEIKSLLALNNKYSNLEFIPICTDTILSPLSAEILNELFDKNSDIKTTLPIIITDLQVSDYKRYKKGLINLVNELNRFSYEGYFYDVILNITGGFKGVIPYMTIYGQVNDIPIFYIFEFTDSLIEIPQIPLSIDHKIFEDYWKEFFELEIEEIKQKNDFNYEFLQKYENILEIEDDLVSLNPLGKILWDKYRRENFMFFTTDKVFNEILKMSNIVSILKKKFIHNYKDKTEIKNGHYVYDDGNNPYRIFYFEDDGKIYIYKAFENHDKYKDFLNAKSFTEQDKKEFKQKVRLFKI